LTAAIQEPLSAMKWLAFWLRCHKTLLCPRRSLLLKWCLWDGRLTSDFFATREEKDLAIAWQAMEATHTQSFAERRVSELSGGERQRLIIARALTQQPKAMLLDEPTANLDINHQVEILNLVKSLCLEQSLTVIIALHDLNLAAQYCDWMVMLNGGKVHAEGTPLDILTAPNIKKVYGAEVCVYPHPINKLPTTLITACPPQSYDSPAEVSRLLESYGEQVRRAGRNASCPDHSKNS
jgi:ABC-type multidrug transport system ATPase subunit